MRTNPGERPYQSQPVCQKGAYKNKSKNEMVQDMGRNKNKTSGGKYIYTEWLRREDALSVVNLL